MALSTGDIFLGYGGIVGFAVESTYDTPAASATWLPLVSWSPNHEFPQIEQPHLNGGVGRVAMQYYTERDDTGGTFTVLASYAAVGTFLRLAMGPAPSTTGAGPYTHPFLLGDVLASGTFRFYRGNSAGGTLTDRYHEVSGAMVTRLTLRLEAGQPPMLEIEYIGCSTNYGNQATPTVTYPTPVLYQQAGNISWNSASYDGNALELTIDNGIARRRNIGNLKTAKPVPSALRQVVLRLTRDHCDETLVAALLAQTESDLTITLTGTGNNSLAIELHSARVVSPDNIGISEGGYGAIPEVIEFKPRNVPAGTDYGLAVTLINDNASYLT